MKSALPKVLHPVGGLPMVLWSVQNARALGAEPVVLVVGVAAEAVQGDGGRRACSMPFQAERLGTGHAALQARELLAGRGRCRAGALWRYAHPAPGDAAAPGGAAPRERRPAITMLSVLSRMTRWALAAWCATPEGRVQAIVEEAVATPEILALKELNCGVYCFDADWLWEHLPQVPVTQPKGEYYLTDMVGLAVQPTACACEVLTISDVTEVQGINTRVHLAQSERIMRERINERLMLSRRDAG